MAIIGALSLNRYVAPMGGERLALQRICPSCGQPMGLVRTIPASPGYRELQDTVAETAECGSRKEIVEKATGRVSQCASESPLIVSVALLVASPLPLPAK